MKKPKGVGNRGMGRLESSRQTIVELDASLHKGDLQRVVCRSGFSPTKVLVKDLRNGYLVESVKYEAE